MKKIFAFLFVALCAMSVDAQIWSSNSSMTVYSQKEKAPKAMKSGYNRISLSYAGMKYNFDGEKSDALKGFDFGYDHGLRVSKSLPIYIEAGVHIQFNRLSEEEKYTYSEPYTVYDFYNGTYSTHYNTYTRTDDVEMTHLDFSIPVSVTYRYSYKGAFVAPFFGLHMKVNALDDVFDSDYDGSHRAQLGCQVGANFGYKALNVQIGYKADFMTIMEETKTGTFYVGLGVNF